MYPGEILREYLELMGLRVYKLANAINIPRSRANDIGRRKRWITTDTALQLVFYSGTTVEFWINLKTHNDLDVTNCNLRRKSSEELSHVLYERTIFLPLTLCLSARSRSGSTLAFHRNYM